MSEVGPLNRVIGERVKAQRQGRGWTLDQLAEASGVSRRTVVSLEAGAANPSIGLLLKLSDALGVGLSALVAEPRRSTHTVTRNGTGPTLWTGDGGGRAVLVASIEPPDVVELWDWTLGPGDRHASDAHATGTRELALVVKGSVAIEIADEVVTLRAGDAVSFASDVPHAYVNPGRSPARFSLSVFEPDVGARRERVTHG